VGDNVTEKDIEAKLENGVLTLNVKKQEEKKPEKRYIEIK
ncbi:MAG: Hsp20 family protein, partial [Bacilli bacterium]|nr:Hsp20 family protein [Bacilli bacterium]